MSDFVLVKASDAREGMTVSLESGTRQIEHVERRGSSWVFELSGGAIWVTPLAHDVSVLASDAVQSA